jgi:hypothetical protein
VQPLRSRTLGKGRRNLSDLAARVTVQACKWDGTFLTVTRTPAEARKSGKKSGINVMSMFNTEEICMDCKALEKMRPDYKDAVETDSQAIRRGDCNFPGMGLRRNDA